MTDDEICKLFTPLFEDLREADYFPNRRPLLAHYTSIVGLEAILCSNEVWLSNPAFHERQGGGELWNPDRGAALSREFGSRNRVWKLKTVRSA
jgi:hypothetical protein